MGLLKPVDLLIQIATQILFWWQIRDDRGKTRISSLALLRWNAFEQAAVGKIFTNPQHI
jgi:hypothetical protein